MVCSKCGNESTGSVCDKCGTPLISRLDDSTETLEEATTPMTTPQVVATTPMTTPQVMATTPQVVAQVPVQQAPVQQVPVQAVVQPATVPVQQVPVQVAAQPQQVPVQTPTQAIPTVPVDANVGAAVPVDASHMVTAQASEEGIDSSATGTTAIEGVSDSVMNEVSVPSDFKLLDEVEGDDFDPLNAGPKVPIEDNVKAKKKRVPKGKKTIKKAIRKTKNMFGKIIVAILLIIAGIYFWNYYVEPSGFLLDIFNK